MDNMHSFFSQLCHSPIARLAVVTLVMLAWSSLAFCGEIHDVAQKGDLRKVKALLKDNPDLLFSKDNSGWTPLHYAAAYGHKNVVELLLANKADVNAKDNSGWTPLHCAAAYGHKDVVVLLLANKADVNAKDKGGTTPLFLAADKGHKDIAELLRQHGGQDVSTAMQPAQTVGEIHDAAKGGDLEKVTALLKDNPDLVFRKDNSGRTPLHWAAINGHKDVAELLLVNKADVNAKTNGGTTPLFLAAANGYKDVAELLLVNKADVNAKTNYGSTPLHMAAGYGHKDVAELLRQHGGHE